MLPKDIAQILSLSPDGLNLHPQKHVILPKSSTDSPQIKQAKASNMLSGKTEVKKKYMQKMGDAVLNFQFNKAHLILSIFPPVFIFMYSQF